LLDEVTGLCLPRQKVTSKEFCPLGRVVYVSNILFEIGGDFSVPYGGRNGNRDGATDGTPEVEYSNGDSHILMGYRSLNGNVRCSDDDSSANTSEYLRAHQDGIGGTGGR
jgi:hypothetical protein